MVMMTLLELSHVCTLSVYKRWGERETKRGGGEEGNVVSIRVIELGLKKRGNWKRERKRVK
jgi:hypothetical protein